MNQANYPNSLLPSRALKRGRMEIYGAYGSNNHGSTPFRQHQQQLLQRPVFFKSHSASEAIFSSRHAPPDHVVMHHGYGKSRGGLYMPTPKRSRSVGYPPAVGEEEEDYSPQQQQQHLALVNASLPAVVTPSREFNAYPLQQKHFENHCYYGNQGTADTRTLESGSFVSHHVKSMNHERRGFPATSATTAMGNKIQFHPFHKGVQQVTPSSSCDYGDSLRSLPRLEYTQDIEEPLLPTSVPDLFEPYNILDKDGAVCPDIIEPIDVHCTTPDETTSDFIAGSFAPDDIQSTFCYHDGIKGDCNLDQNLASARCQGGLVFSKEYETNASYPIMVENAEDGTALATSTTDDDKRDALSTNHGQARFRDFHEKKWNDHLKELCEFKKQHGHCLVPHTFPENQPLARWVKRQRRQYKLMQDGDASSTMTQERVELLNREGFVWDSHEVVWRERYEQLVRYKEQHGHCRVPSYCKENPQLATWVKCQRRQYKLFWEGKRSSMSVERTQLLEDIGFVWEVRSDKCLNNKDESLKKLAEILNDL